jgi:hypothetical protein
MTNLLVDPNQPFNLVFGDFGIATLHTKNQKKNSFMGGTPLFERQ